MVSVIIPTYKRSDYICRAIESVLNQDYNDIEILVVDDNNEDSEDRKNMEKIMEKYASNSKVNYIKHKKNMNGAAARNTGIAKAKGEYITFLDDDDFFLKGRISELVKCLDENPTYDAAYTGLIIMINNKFTDIFPAIKEGNLELDLLNLNSFFKSGSNLFLRAEAVRELNGFDTDFIRHQDLEFMVRFFEKHQIKAIDSYSVIKDDSSRINSPNIIKSFTVKKLYIEKFNNTLEKYDKNKICLNIYQQLLNICDKKATIYNEIEKEMEKYGCKNPKKDWKHIIKGNKVIKKIYKKVCVITRKSKIKNEIKEIKQSFL